jgi:hypothetical protein
MQAPAPNADGIGLHGGGSPDVGKAATLLRPDRGQAHTAQDDVGLASGLRETSSPQETDAFTAETVSAADGEGLQTGPVPGGNG